MKIEIWSDFVCPFCYIGKANLLQAIQELGLNEVEFAWRSFELDPAYPHDAPHHHYDLLQQKYDLSQEAAKAKCDQLSAIGQSCGLNMNFDQAYYGNTFLAHQLQQYANAQDTDTAAKINNALFMAVFEHGLAIDDMNVLVNLAQEQGLNADEVRNSLLNHQHAPKVREDEQNAHAMQVSGVPFFGFDGRLAVAGAQSIDAFKEVMQHILNNDASEDSKLMRQ